MDYHHGMPYASDYFDFSQEPKETQKGKIMKIKIIAIDLSTATDKKGKPYQIVEVSYKNLSFNKVESRKIMPFGNTADTSKLLAKAAKDEIYDIEVVKNTAGFNDWVSATKVEEGDTSPAATPGKNLPASSYGAVSTPAKSTYETPEERAKKQVLIVRQSSLSNAVDFLKIANNKSTSVSDVLSVARQFEDYVFNINPPNIIDTPNDLDMDDDIPV